MAVAKVLEVSAESTESFDDAIRQGIERTCQTMDNVQGAWVKDQEVVINDGKIAGYRADLKITFVMK